MNKLWFVVPGLDLISYGYLFIIGDYSGEGSWNYLKYTQIANVAITVITYVYEQIFIVLGRESLFRSWLIGEAFMQSLLVCLWGYAFTRDSKPTDINVNVAGFMHILNFVGVLTEILTL